MKWVLFLQLLVGSLCAMDETEAQKNAMTHLPDALQEHLKDIQTEIDATTIELKNERKLQSNLEVEAQKLLPTKWDEYTLKIEEAERHEKAANILEARLKQIINEKKDIESALKGNY